jgi:hypothetical protein
MAEQIQSYIEGLVVGGYLVSLCRDVLFTRRKARGVLVGSV